MDEVHAIVERQRPNQVVLQIGLGELGSRTALRLADCRLLGIDPDATEVHNHAPVFSTQPLGTAKVEIIGRALERRRRDPAGRRWVQGYFPDALGAAALRRVSVVSCAVDSYADRRNVMVAARAVGVPVVDVGGLDDTGQVTVYGASPEAACIECEIGGSHLGALDRLPALTRSGCGDPHQGPSAWIADRIATEAAGTVRRLLEEGAPSVGTRLTVRRRRHRLVTELTRSPSCRSLAHVQARWLTVDVDQTTTLGTILAQADLADVTLPAPMFRSHGCQHCGECTELGRTFDRQSVACSRCHEPRALVWSIGRDDPLADVPVQHLGLPPVASVCCDDGRVWIELRQRDDSLAGWLDAAQPSVQSRPARTSHPPEASDNRETVRGGTCR